MTDVIKVAQDKRARKLAQIEELMAEVEELDDFISFGNALSAEDKGDAGNDRSDDTASNIAAE